MGLIIPLKDYYRLDEVAKELGCSVEDLLMWGAEGKLQFSIRLRTSSLIDNISLACLSCGATENVSKDGKIYDLSVETLKYIWGDTRIKFDPLLVCSKCGKDLVPNYNFDANDPCFDERSIRADEIIRVNELLVRFDNIEKFKESHCVVIDETQAPLEQEERWSKNQVQETGKQKLTQLKEVFQKLKEVERDQDVIAARLCDEHEAKGWQLVKILDIAHHLPKEKNRERAAYRSRDRGRKIIKSRLEVK